MGRGESMKKLLSIFLILTFTRCSSSGPSRPESNTMSDSNNLLQASGDLSESKKFQVREKEKEKVQLATQPDVKDGSERGFPIVIRMERTSPVLTRPSSKSRVLADVVKGTTLIARKITPQGHWLLVEDEDENKGWVPQVRTNYSSLKRKEQEVSSTFKNNNLNASMEMIEDPNAEDIPRDEPEVFDSDDLNKTVETPEVWLVSTEIVKTGYGIRVGYLTSMAKDSRNADHLRRIGFDFGLTQGWTAGNLERVNTTLGLRMRLLSQTEGQNFGTGPDLGIIYQLQAKKWGPALGYSLGFVPGWGEGFIFLVKAGLEWPGWSTDVNLGIETGWVF
jgi:hypothetical protein